MNVLRHEDRSLEQDTSTDADVHLDLMRRRMLRLIRKIESVEFRLGLLEMKVDAILKCVELPGVE